MRVDRQQQAQSDLSHALNLYEHARDPEGDNADLTEAGTAEAVAQAAWQLLGELEEPADRFRVRMTMWHGDDPSTGPHDRYMPAIPAVGDRINTDGGVLIVNEVYWNFQSAIPADVVLMLITPEEEAAQRFENGEDDPMCMGCSHTYGEHCSDNLECPDSRLPSGFSDVKRFTA